MTMKPIIKVSPLSERELTERELRLVKSCNAERINRTSMFNVFNQLIFNFEYRLSNKL
jgi:hypothetical protein